MKLDWQQVSKTVERCLTAAQKGERGGLRVHCGAAERILKGAKDDSAREVLDSIHRAKTAIEHDKSIEYLEKAFLVAKHEATGD